MKPPAIFYVFRRPTEKEIRLSAIGKLPEDNFYAYTRLKKTFNLSTTDAPFKKNISFFLQALVDRITPFFIDLGFSIIPALILLPYIKKADIVFATTDTYGLPLGLYKLMRLYDKPLIINTIGLYDGLIRRKNIFALFMAKKILLCTNHIISGGSMDECNRLSALLDIPKNKFTFIPFGIDTSFFYPRAERETDEILAVGADPNRDWQTYQKIAMQLPNEHFRFVSNKTVALPMPKNVLFEYNLTFDQIRDRFWTAKIVLILSKMNHHFAGQSTAFRAMSCGKPVILTQTPGTEEYMLKNRKHCIFVPVGNVESTIEEIKWLNGSRKRRLEMGYNASKLFKDLYSLENYSKKLARTFNKVLRENAIQSI